MITLIPRHETFWRQVGFFFTSFFFVLSWYHFNVKKKIKLHYNLMTSSSAGHRLKGRDVLKAGIATHVCDGARIGELEESLLNLQSPYPEDVAAVLDKFHEVSVTWTASLYCYCSRLSSDFLFVYLFIVNQAYGSGAETVFPLTTVWYLVCLHNNVHQFYALFGAQLTVQSSANLDWHNLNASLDVFVIPNRSW